MSGAAGSYKDVFWLSGWVSALSYAVSVIVPLYVCGKLSINVMPRAICENSHKTFKISAVHCCIHWKTMLFCMAHGGLCNIDKLFKSAGSCLTAFCHQRQSNQQGEGGMSATPSAHLMWLSSWENYRLSTTLPGKVACNFTVL